MPDPLPRLVAALSDRYRLERELGQGGMATVYLAQDIKHDRKVAVKVLRPELAAVIGAERFLAEIKTTANLQHPHILPLFDSGEADGFLFYVMPYVEGETVRDRMAREKQLPVADAVRIAIEVASALDYAHRHNVIHRDIKPENILLHDGRALVADFGIALAASKAGGSRMTETGMSLGTPHYMSPEQAMGEREITARSDVYALGCVLYEMLLGEPPFTGPTAQSIVAKVMTEKPAPLTSRRERVPPAVEDAVLTALEKLPADRFATAAEFAQALSGERTPSLSTRPERAAPPKPSRTLTTTLATVALVTTAVAGWALLREDALAGPAVYDAALPDSAPMAFGATITASTYGASFRNLSVSPAGDFVIYAAREGDSTALWYRSLRDAAAHPINGTQAATTPRLSPDGSRIAYLRGDQVMLVPLAGGEARRLLAGQSAFSVDWTSPTELLVIDLDGNRANWIDPDGGTTRSKDIPRCTLGAWDAASHLVICTGARTAFLLDPESGERWPIRTAAADGSPGPLLTGSAFRIVDGRYLLYVAVGGNLLAARYDPKTHLVHRSATLLTNLRREALGEAHFDISPDGLLVYGPGVDAAVGRMVSLRPGGRPLPLPVEPADFQRYDLSPDRRWLAASVQAAEGTELRIFDLRDGQQFTWLRAEMVRHPLWSPDGERLLVAVRDTTHYAILAGAPNSGVPPDTLTSIEASPSSPDPVDYLGEHTALAEDWANSITMRFDPAAAAPRFDTVLTATRFPTVSPNGKLLAVQSLDGNRVIVTAFPVPGRRWQVASDGVEPLWLSSSELLYRAGVSWYLARVNPDTGEPFGAATLWARDPRFSDTSGWSNRLSHDGGIIYVQGPEETSATFLRAVPGWVSQMKAAVDAANR